MSLTCKALMLALGFIIPLFQNAPSGQTVSTGAKLEIRLAEEKPAYGLIKAYSPDTKRNIYLHKTALVTNQDIIEARVRKISVPEYILEYIKAGAIKVDRDLDELYEISVRFTKEAGERMAQATERHFAKRLAILVDGKVISAPSINSRFSDEAVIVGGLLGFTKEEAQRIASALNKR